MDDKKFLIIIGVVTTLLIGGGAFFALNYSATPAVESSTGVSAAVNETTHDWGRIGINDGDVSVAFPIKNEGTKNLKLFNIKTSCMCTTAQLKLGDDTSPPFGMHTQSSYVLDVPPGKTADLQVVFDPAFHGPQGTGPITREIIVETNDSQNPQLSFVANALVVK